MDKIEKPKGLIRYASENGIANQEKLKFTARIKAYSFVLLLLLGILTILLVTRKDVSASILRTPGMLFQVQENNQISNLYNIKMINKTHKTVPISFKLESKYGSIKMVGKPLRLVKEAKGETEFFILLPKEKIIERKTTVYIGIYSGKEKLQTVKTTFLGPITLKH